jgi:RNA ligase (TIGR02306 family)
MENQNSVCFVAKVNEVREIPGADNIELIVAGGWNCISKKGEQIVGDNVIIATTDAVIPEGLSEEMGVTSYLRKGNRVRTVKLRGVYSECLIIPHKYLHGRTTMGDWDLKEGSDCMDIFGVSKFEPPVKQIQLASGRKIKYKDNPNFHIYYKFPNLKNVAGMFTEDDFVEITRKIHGTNARYGICKKTKLSFFDKVKKFFGLADGWIDYEYVVGSHNVEKGSDSQGFYDTNVWYNIANDLDIKRKLWQIVRATYSPEEIGSGFVIYGEIYGKGVQKNYEYGLDTIDFAGFDITVDGKYMTPMNANSTFEFLDLPYVPILYFGKWSQDVQDSFVFNNFIKGSKVPEEGIVIKYYTGERQKVAKVINPDYLIYGEKHNVGDSH